MVFLFILFPFLSSSCFQAIIVLFETFMYVNLFLFLPTCLLFFSIYLLHLFCLVCNDEVFPFENENLKWILFSCIIHIYAEVCRLCILEQQSNNHWIRSVFLSVWILLENVFVYCICICILLEAIFIIY